MKSKVTLKETVGTRIVYAVLLGCYYWMWARKDWHDYYTVIQHVVVIFTIVFFAIQAGRVYRCGREGKDEQAIQNLRRTDAILFKILAAAAILIAFASAVTFADGRMTGYALIGTIIALSVIRLVLLSVMDRRKA